MLVIAGFLVIGLLYGCSMKSEEDTLEGAREAAETSFLDESPIPANGEMMDRDIYLPDYVEEESREESNLILSNGEQTIIVFFNPLEPADSKLHFETASRVEGLLLDSFEGNGEFGYIRILPDEGEGYELQVGAGGVKVTTFTSKGNLERDAGELMRTAKSLIAPN